MADDEFGFSDDDLDDLPANTLQHLEASAIRATQQQVRADAESDYGLDDGDEVINLDHAPGPPRASAWATNTAPPYTQPQQEYQHDYAHHDDDRLYNDHMDVEDQTRMSQTDPHQLLLHIKKVRRTRWMPTPS
jgi:hypothetical protein